jgi:hypothetical protein
MSQPRRAELFDVLAELRSRYPDWRFGQLIANVADWADQQLWDIEDDQLIAAAKEHLQSVGAKESEKNASRV